MEKKHYFPSNHHVDFFQVLANLGAAYGTAKSGVGIANLGVPGAWGRMVGLNGWWAPGVPRLTLVILDSILSHNYPNIFQYWYWISMDIDIGYIYGIFQSMDIFQWNKLIDIGISMEFPLVIDQVIFQ